MNILQRVLIIFTVLFTFSCATQIPTQDAMREETKDFQLPQVPEDGEALIYIARPSAKGGSQRFKVYLNGQEQDDFIGSTKGATFICISVKPGIHEIFSKAENWAITTVDVKEGDTVFLQQNIQYGFWMARNSINPISDDQGRYWVKKLKKRELN